MRRVRQRRRAKGMRAISQLNHRGGAPIRIDKKMRKVRKGWLRSKMVSSFDSSFRCFTGRLIFIPRRCILDKIPFPFQNSGPPPKVHFEPSMTRLLSPYQGIYSGASLIPESWYPFIFSARLRQLRLIVYSERSIRWKL